MRFEKEADIRQSIEDGARDGIHDECGVFGVYGLDAAAATIYNGLFSMQHRGQEGAGIVVSDGLKVRSRKGAGLVAEALTPERLAALPGHIGIGHVRYSTTGANKVQNIQPLVVECSDGIWAVAHNGNLTNAGALRTMYQDAGAIFQTSTDSEVLVHLLADPMYRLRPQRVARALGELKGAFSFLIMTKDCLMGARDRHAFRPLSIGRCGDVWYLSSETCAFKLVGAEHVRDVEPGELVTIDSTGLHSHRFAEPAAELRRCVFENIYFARPDSKISGHNVHEIRMEYGALLAREHPVEADIVIAVPDSGNSAALGYARESGIPLDFGFIRNHYVGRTFIMPNASQRASGVDMKLSVLSEVVAGKRVVVVDDSIVRGTTARRRVAALRESGALEVHVRISCPPICHPCYYGIDLPDRDDLIAAHKSVAEIAEYIGADSIGYLSMESLLAPYEDPQNYCAACFTGEYAVPMETIGGKQALERNG
jgi:amidophosphoribosyltransferase